MVALHEPDVLLLDEPTTGVDPQSREDIWSLISSEAAQGRVVVFATTYLDEAERSSKLYLMNRGRAMVSGTAQDARDKAPGRLWEASVDQGKRLTQDSPFGSGFAQLPAQSAFHNWRRADRTYVWTAPRDTRVPEGFVPAEMDLENASIAFLLNDDEHGVSYAETTHESSTSGVAEETVDVASRAATPKHNDTPLIEADCVVMHFGSFTALHGVSLSVRPGEIIGLIGGNGVGKTTLIRILLGLEQPSQGKGSLFGHTANLEARRHVGYVPQGMGLYPTMSARENLDFAARVYRSTPQGWIVDYVRQLGRMPLGQQPLGTQRLLAYAIADEHKPSLLILDEPTSGMDPVSRMRLWRELHCKADEGIGVLVTTHYMSEASQCDRCVVLAQVAVAVEGTVDDIVGDHRSLVIQTQN